MTDLNNQSFKISYQNQGKAAKSFEQLGYKYDHALSTNESKVFVDNAGNPNIAFRGSKRVSDFLGSDVKLALGLQNYDNRFEDAKRTTRLVEDKYGKAANVYGSSLGGSLAEHSGAKGNIVTHNKGTGFFDIGKTIGKRQTDYRNTNDIVSLLSVTQNHKYGNLKQKQTKFGKWDIIANHRIV